MAKLKLDINVYEYTDYRQFLQDAYEYLHGADSKYSHSFIQKKAGYSPGSNHFWQVATGYAPLSQQAAQRYARVFGLSPKETQFFITLAGMNQAKTDEDRNFYMDQLRQFEGFQNNKVYSFIRYEYYSQWYYPAIREMVALEDFVEDPKAIAERLRPSITAKEAKDAVKRLLDLGFLTRDDYGVLRQSEPHIGDFGNRNDTDSVAKLAVRNYHRHMIELGASSIERISQHERYVVGMTMAVSEHQALELKEIINDFLKKVDNHVAVEQPVETVYRMNLQLFPLIHRKSDQKANKTKRQASSTSVRTGRMSKKGETHE